MQSHGSPRSAAPRIPNKPLLAAGLVLASHAAPAFAQSHQCRLPERIDVPKVRPDGPERRMAVTGYTLALSWSPEFCRLRESDREHGRQCSGRAGRFGFIVHGLWPEGARGWPQWCRSARPARGPDLRANMCLTPSARLLAHQWAKHGACMTRKPATYYRVTRILFDGLRLPDLDLLSREDKLDVGMIRTRLAELNRGWRAEAIGIHLSERGWLEEVQLCYDRRFMPTRCDNRRFGARDSTPIKVWRGL